MILVPKIYGEIVLGLDFLILTTALLFRKSKPKPVKSTSDPKSLRLVGYYLTISAIALLVLNHLCFLHEFANLLRGVID